MKKGNKIFKRAYLIYAAVLAVIVIACSIYVHSVISGYEKAQPEYQTENAIEQLKNDAADKEDFWAKYSLPEVEEGDFEKGVDIKSKYLTLFTDGNAEYAVKNGIYAEDELHYTIKNGDVELAEVVLKATSALETKLAVFSWRDWEISEIIPYFEKKEYEITVPDEFSVKVNDIVLDKQGAVEDNGRLKYVVGGVYFQPEFEVANGSGEKAAFVINKGKVLVEFYDYTLTLPQSLEVKINGEISRGILQENGNLCHEIMFLEKPEVVITDLYGNSVTYEGKSLPLTYMTVAATDKYSVTVDGSAVPEEAVTRKNVAEYEIIADLLEKVPRECRYDIAVLKDGAEVKVFDPDGNEVELEEGVNHHDLMDMGVSLEQVPQEVAEKVDVLQVAQSWSLFMSNDFDFSDLSVLMLTDSYQYEVAKKYNSSVDKTLFSSHSLLDPAFTENEVSNFVWITEDCFSVDISFIKHMRLVTGKYVDDPMNDRFYFINSDGDWLLAAMKEVTADGE